MRRGRGKWPRRRRKCQIHDRKTSTARADSEGNAETSNSFGPIMKIFHHVSNEKDPPNVSNIKDIQIHNFLYVSIIESVIGDQRMDRITVPTQSRSKG